MSAFVRARDPKLWVTGSALGNVDGTGDLETWDANLYKALSDKGGTWNPAARIVVGGAGWRIGTDGDIDDARQFVMSGTAEVSFRAGKVVDRYLDLCGGYASPYPKPISDAGWMLAADAAVAPGWVNRKLGAPVVIPIRAHHGATVETITARIGDSIATHDEAPPQLPTLSLVRAPIGELPQWEPLATAQDEYVDQATYDTGHAISLVVNEPFPFDDDHQYGAMLTAENGDFGETAFILRTLLSMQVSLRVNVISSFMT